MAKKKTAISTSLSQSPSLASGYYTSEEANQLLAATTDEELGRMYRQRKEANEFLQARGLY